MIYHFNVDISYRRKQGGIMAKEIIYERIYNDIALDIKNGVLAPGDKIKTELELANQYGVSRITSKKAMEMLAAEHLVVRTRGRGSFVAEDAKDRLLEKEEKYNAGFGMQYSHIRNPQREDVNIIGVILDTFGEDFGGELLRGIERECYRRNIQMMFQCTYGSVADEDAAIERFLEIGAKGLIILCAQGENYNSTILRLGLDGYPLVLVDRPMKGISIPCVKTDNYKASGSLTDNLIEKGHSHICFVTHSSLETPTISERYAGFTDAILDHEGAVGVSEQLHTFHTTDENMDTDVIDTGEARIIIDNHPDCTAYVAAEYRIGVLLYRASKELRKEIEISTFDNISPTYDDMHDFSYIRQDEKKMGEIAVTTLTDILTGEKKQGTIFVPYEIVAK